MEGRIRRRPFALFALKDGGCDMDRSGDGSGQLYRRNRYYDPASGRFTQADPIGIAGGLNLYGFGDGDPVNFRDPYGLCPYGPEPCSEVQDARIGAAALRWIAGKAGQMSGAVGDFLRNYRNMVKANVIGADQYFHCHANCEATRRGRFGEFTAAAISDAREDADLIKETLGDTMTISEAVHHSAEDDRSNRLGRRGARNRPRSTCAQVCSTRRPQALPEDY